MQDIAFAPETLTVRAGEPVTFAFENVGKVDHEAIIGDESVQDDHEREMSGQDEGHGGSGHSSPQAATRATTLTWTRPH